MSGLFHWGGAAKNILQRPESIRHETEGSFRQGARDRSTHIFLDSRSMNQYANNTIDIIYYVIGFDCTRREPMNRKIVPFAAMPIDATNAPTNR